jgi:phi13 family phage major tail protein
MATNGVRDFFVAKMTITENEDGTVTESYATPKRLAKAINIGLTATIAEALLYADDGIDESASEFVSAELSCNINDIKNNDEAELLGATLDSNDVIKFNKDDIAPYYAVGFRAKKANGQFVYVWLLKAKFKIPDETNATKADSIEFQTPTIVATATPNAAGDWRYKKTLAATDPIAMAWFTTVYSSPAPATEAA